MVNLQLGGPNEAVLQAAGELAGRLQAHVIGTAAGQPLQAAIYGDACLAGDLIEQDCAEIERQTIEAETRFRAALAGKVSNLQWRSMVSFVSLADYIARQARAADLVITGSDHGGPALDVSRCVNLGDLVMRIGRPVLIVPRDTDTIRLENVVVGWKETREARRAVLDALPLLKLAGHVTVVEITAEEETAVRSRLEDLADWLRGHEVAAEALAEPAHGEDAARLENIAHQRNAGLLVAGAYGHNRLREWVLGGVTRDLLLRPKRCTLVSL
jgi:nucleotide-binding universal stress UspA family protein